MAREGKLKFTVSCAKFASFDKAVREYCFLHNLKCDIQITNGIIFADYFVTIEGTEDELLKARDVIRQAIQDYQKRMD